MMVRSCHLPRRSAAMIPTDTPTVIHRTKAPSASWMVTGSAVLIIEVTSSPRRNE